MAFSTRRFCDVRGSFRPSWFRGLSGSCESRVRGADTNIRTKETAPHGASGVPRGPAGRKCLLNVENVLAIASGKGGVGKSTVAVNLALSMARLDQRVGLLDADVHGPSIPIMMNLSEEKCGVSERRYLQPLMNYGLKCMSTGFLAEKSMSIVWRGPMVTSALEQMLHRVEWGELDVLVVDLPPGTGDAHLTLTQSVRLAGALIVSTPQVVAASDVVRSIHMFRGANVPVLGIIENMSYFQCTTCQERHAIFGRNSSNQIAEKWCLDFLGELPMDQRIVDACDSGRPIVVSEPDSMASRQYGRIASLVLQKMRSGKSRP